MRLVQTVLLGIAAGSVVACADRTLGPTVAPRVMPAFSGTWVQCSPWIYSEFYNSSCGVALNVQPEAARTSSFSINNLPTHEQNAPPQHFALVEVTLGTAVRRLDLWYSIFPYTNGPLPEQNTCPTPGALKVRMLDGREVDVTPEAWDESTSCGAQITVRDDAGIAGFTLAPTPDAPRYRSCSGYWDCPPEGHLGVYEPQAAVVDFGWDVPPDTLCAPTGKGLLDYKPFRDSLWVALQRSGIDRPHHERKEIAGEVVVNRLSGDTIVR